MKPLKILFDLYLKSSTHVSVAVVSFAAITYLNFNTKPDPDLLLFIFFGTVTGYNFVKYAAVAGFQHFSLSQPLRIIQIYSFFCFVGLMWFTLKLPADVLFAAGILGVINVLYAFPLFSGDNLRSVTGIKIFIIALVWTGVTVLLPVLEAEMEFTVNHLMASLQRFLFVIVLTLPFDIRDLRFDTEQLGTIPQIFGVKTTRIIGITFLVIIFLLEFFQSSANATEILILLVVVIITAYLLRKSVIRQTKYYASFWVEGIPILWLGLLMLSRL